MLVRSMTQQLVNCARPSGAKRCLRGWNEARNEYGTAKSRDTGGYADHLGLTRLVDDIHVVGKVLWKVTRML